MTGMAYAAVFPDPVRARARMSLPCKANGIAFSCIGNGLCQPSLATAYKQQRKHYIVIQLFLGCIAESNSTYCDR